MTKQGKFSQAEITRAIKGMIAAGKTVTSVRIDPDGAITVFTQRQDQPDDWRQGTMFERNSLDRLHE